MIVAPGLRRTPPGTVLLLALAALAGCGGDSTGPERPPPEPPTAQEPPLRKVAADRGVTMGIGTAVGKYFGRADEFGTKYGRVLGREFNVLTAENDMKFGPLRPSRDVFRFGRADSMLAFAKANGMKVRGHTLVWHNQLSSWLTGGSWTKEETEALLDEHVTEVVKHYRGQLVAWDVVNEAVADDGSLRSTFWSDRIGREYIEQAFRAARAADPEVALFYNDYGIEWPGAKQDSVYALLSDLRARGVPVTGVGFQAHFEVGSGTPSKATLRATFDRFAALGLRIHVTELDIRLPLPSTAQNLQVQAHNYRDVFEVCMQTPACDMVVTWGFTDLDSWVPSTFPGKGDALLFDAAINPKPAYWSVHSLLSGK